MKLPSGRVDGPRFRLSPNKRFTRITRVTVATLFIVVFLSLLRWRRIHWIGNNIDTQESPGSQEQREPEGPQEPEYYRFPTTSSFSPVSVDSTGKTTTELCALFPRHLLNTIQPIIKTGHGDDPAKTEGQFNSVSACFDPEDLLVFSDLEETLHGHRTIDILADLPQTYYDFDSNPDFQHYVWQKEMRDNGTLDIDKEGMKRINGWRLDRFKFLPMIEKTWSMRPNKEFYFFYETDTYVFWDNAFRFLQTLDPDTPQYIASPSPGRRDAVTGAGTWFGNGGPGFVLSRAAIKILLHRETGTDGRYIDPPLHDKWASIVKPDCCGDSILGWAFWTLDVMLQGYWPMFNPHNIQGIPYSDTYWCQPVVTLHKSEPKDMMQLWRWEQGQRQSERPILYSDMWRFRHPGQPAILNNWDNAGWDETPPKANATSLNECEKLCRDDESCLQWNWRGKDQKECRLMQSIRYGVARMPEKLPEEDKTGEFGEKIERWVDYTAGFMEERVSLWKNERKCDIVQWVGPSLKRTF